MKTIRKPEVCDHGFRPETVRMVETCSVLKHKCRYPYLRCSSVAGHLWLVCGCPCHRRRK